MIPPWSISSDLEPNMSEHVLVSTAAGVMEIVFNRPDKKNALTNEMYGIWADAMERAANDPLVRAILFRAEGATFTAGNDIADFAMFAGGGASFGEMQVGRVLKALAFAEKPLIAAVAGHAVGIGMTMLLHCDMAFAAEDAKLSAPFVNLALVPEAASSALLPQAIGAKRAYAMFAAGEPMLGREAAALGVVTKALPAAEILPAARAAAAMLAAKPAGALAATKRLMRDGRAIAAIMDAEGALFTAQMRSPEAREAFAAFLERRTPDFSKLG
jgi:enoyl-CoA hydratase/carnithine racemase